MYCPICRTVNIPIDTFVRITPIPSIWATVTSLHHGISCRLREPSKIFFSQPSRVGGRWVIALMATSCPRIGQRIPPRGVIRMDIPSLRVVLNCEVSDLFSLIIQLKNKMIICSHIPYKFIYIHVQSCSVSSFESGESLEAQLLSHFVYGLVHVFHVIISQQISTITACSHGPGNIILSQQHAILCTHSQGS